MVSQQQVRNRSVTQRSAANIGSIPTRKPVLRQNTLSDFVRSRSSSVPGLPSLPQTPTNSSDGSDIRAAMPVSSSTISTCLSLKPKDTQRYTRRVCQITLNGPLPQNRSVASQSHVTSKFGISDMQQHNSNSMET